ncbi:MAG: substrate-binding domain-containing protein [Gemmatimonadales bacterium]
MKFAWNLIVVAGLLVGGTGLDSQEIILATTTSVRDAGLLDELLPIFERRTGLSVRTIAVGSGQALALGRRGEADILIVHDAPSELEFIREGYGTVRAALMHNEFILVGPATDPAGVRGRGTTEAFRRIATLGATRFMSRGDDSGTHRRELMLWRGAGVAPNQSWYLEAGQGMSATLQIAYEFQAYALTDIGTYLTHPASEGLEILVQGDSTLANPYHVLLVNPERHPRVNATLARLLLEYLVDPETQATIGSFRRSEFGRSIFVPDAVSSVH